MRKPFVPSPEQRAVIESTAPRLVVAASAGAGKTSVLVARYLRHVIEEGLRPDQILTITFTKKAAAEMKKRIVQALREHNLTEEAQIAETGPIQTVHSFCERLLRENSLEAGLDPAFDVMDPAAQSRLQSECLRAALAMPLDDMPEAQRFLMALSGASEPGQSAFKKVEDTLSKLVDEFRAAGLKRPEVAFLHRSADAIREKWNEIILAALPEEIERELPKDLGATLTRTIKTIAKANKLKTPAWFQDAEPATELAAAEFALGMFQLANEVWRLYEEALDRSQTLDFNALEIHALQLMESSPVTQERVQNQYQVVMIDEAQDINPVQDRLIDALQARSTLVVGDAQQSIYAFRHADVEAFQRRSQVGLHELKLNHRSVPGVLNFVNDVFRETWSQEYRPMISPDAKPPSLTLDFDEDFSGQYDGVEIWQHDDFDAFRTAQKIQRMIALEDEKPGDITVLVRGAGSAIRMRAALTNLGQPSVVSGGVETYYTRLEVRDVANALRAIADPWDDFALLACLRSPVVNLSMDAIVLLAARREGRPLVDTLAEFVSPLEEDHTKLANFLTWYHPLRDYADRLSAWEAVSAVLARSPYLSAIASRPNREQTLANVRKLVVLAAQQPDLGPLEYADWIQQIRKLKHKESEGLISDQSNCVTIMTMHKAKGLEFPVVVLPDTHLSPIWNSEDLCIAGRRGTAVYKSGKAQPLIHRFLTEERKGREREEAKRLAYVAMTRAQRRLCVCLHTKNKPDSVSRWLGDIVQNRLQAPVITRT